MTKQKCIEFDSIINDLPTAFRTIHYLGSKLRVLSFIKEVVDEIDPNKKGVCDLFSGSGSVSQYLASERKIVSVDVQNYSNIICTALLKPVCDDFILSFPKRVSNSERLSKYLTVFAPIIELEEKLINGLMCTDLELVCNFLENASLYSTINKKAGHASDLLKIAFEKTMRALSDFEENSFLATKYFGGVYFSYKQAICLDAILDNITEVESKYRPTLLAALLSTASDIVNTVGKQFAQPIRPRNKNGTPKTGIIKQLRKDRNLNVLSVYTNWVNKYAEIKVSTLKHEILIMDFKKALDKLDDDVSTVYADPPYTRDHYSRFYHGLETLCLMDYPSVSTTNIGGVERLSRGLYREEREQSDFCIRSKAPQAFEELFKIVAKKKKNLLLSYSPYNKENKAHPRVVEIDFLETMALKYFTNVEIRSLGKFTHSKLNRSDLHLDAEESAEVLIICKN